MLSRKDWIPEYSFAILYMFIFGVFLPLMSFYLGRNQLPIWSIIIVLIVSGVNMWFALKLIVEIYRFVSSYAYDLASGWMLYVATEHYKNKSEKVFLIKGKHISFEELLQVKSCLDNCLSFYSIIKTEEMNYSTAMLLVIMRENTPIETEEKLCEITETTEM